MHVVCDEFNAFDQKSLLEDKDASFRKEPTILEEESKEKNFEQSKENIATPPKSFLRNEEPKEASP